MSDSDSILDQLGLKGFLKTYEFKSLSKHIWFSIILSSIYLGILFISENDSKIKISEILDLGIDILPNLLGFLLGGYAILISFGSVKFLKMVTKVIEDQKTSLFQKTSLNFTLSIFVNCITLLLVFFVKLISDLDYVIPLFSYPLIQIVNLIVLFLIVFLMIFTIVLLPQLLFNVYNFTTVYSVLIQTEDEEKES